LDLEGRSPPNDGKENRNNLKYQILIIVPLVTIVTSFQKNASLSLFSRISRKFGLVDILKIRTHQKI